MFNKKTKIVCTVGPASNNYETIKQLINSGMNVVRLNFSHGTIDEHDKTIDLIRRVETDLNTSISILIDLPGPKLRIGMLDKVEYELVKGDKIELTKEKIVGNNRKFSCSYKEIVDCLEVNDLLYINDGLIKCAVTGKTAESLFLEVLSGGKIRSHKGINIPSEHLDIDVVTARDIEFIKFAIKKDIDFIAVSYARKKEDIKKVKDMILASGKRIFVTAKIENPQAIKNIDEIIDETDTVMVARGDLGIEIPVEEVAVKQKIIIDKARKSSKPVIVATQMLKSMTDNNVPTRAEVSDVTNAILDGADAVMLSEETAIGVDPSNVCLTMSRICITVEKELDNIRTFKAFDKDQAMYPELAVSYSVEELCRNLKIKALSIFTKSGKTARLISSRKINLPAIVFTNDRKTYKLLNLCWGSRPVYMNTGFSTAAALDYIKANSLFEKGSLIIITLGTDNTAGISTNLIEIQSAL